MVVKNASESAPKALPAKEAKLNMFFLMIYLNIRLIRICKNKEEAEKSGTGRATEGTCDAMPLGE